MSENNIGQIFNGYNIKYPEFAVITPQRKQSFTVRCMTVSEEELLKGSLLTPTTIAEHLAQVLWTCIVKKPDDIQTYDDFIKKVTLRDRDALVYGLFVATYKDTQAFSFKCQNPDCGVENKVKINMEKGFQFQIWDKETDCFNYREKIPLKILNGVECYLKAPLIADEIESTKNSLNLSQEDSNLVSELLMIDYFKLPDTVEMKKDENGNDVQVKIENKISDRNEIFNAYKKLPSYDRKLITKSYADSFDKYRIGVVAKNTCRCGYEQEVRIDITRQFFLALY